MKILVANLGSTSFKFKLLDMNANGEELARGGYERIGQPGSPFRTHADVIDVILKELADKGLKRPDAIGFKAVHGGPISGAVRVDDKVLATMEQFSDVAPAHNPPYIAAMRAFREKLPGLPQVAAFETAFHDDLLAGRCMRSRTSGTVKADAMVSWGDHRTSRRRGRSSRGARHLLPPRLVQHRVLTAKRRQQLCKTAQSACRIKSSRRLDTRAARRAGPGPRRDQELGKEGGMLGMSGVSPDMRDVEQAAAKGDARAKLALDAFVESVRSFVGSYLVFLGGCDVLAFTGGIGENGAAIREAVCRNLGFAGIFLDPQKNNVRGRETKISAVESGAEIWIVPTTKN
jgi:acetate kinase